MTVDGWILVVVVVVIVVVISKSRPSPFGKYGSSYRGYLNPRNIYLRYKLYLKLFIF